MRAQKALGDLGGLVGALDDLHAARFAAAAGVDLGLDHGELAAQLLEGGFRLLGRRRQNAVLNAKPILLEQFFGLIFV